MTIGQKLAGYRKLSGMTQQQLGDYLNISAQAISKWEKDLSEPALATLRILADLYKVSIDELLNLESGFDLPTLSTAEDEKEETVKDDTASVVGFCQTCGVKVTEENLGAMKPKVICSSCLDEAKERERRALEDEKKRKEDAERLEKARINGIRARRTRHLKTALIVAGAVSAVFLILMIVSMCKSYSGFKLAVTPIVCYITFSFVACLFYDCIVQDAILESFTKSLSLPGLIFTFDLDGCLWFLGMKLLFGAIGIAFGILAALAGVVFGLIIAPFVFPIVMIKEKIGISKGKEL